MIILLGNDVKKGLQRLPVLFQCSGLQFKCSLKAGNLGILGTYAHGSPAKFEGVKGFSEEVEDIVHIVVQSGEQCVSFRSSSVVRSVQEACL